MRPLIGPLAALLGFAAFLALVSAWLAVHDALLPAAAVGLLVAATWAIGYHRIWTGRVARPVARPAQSFGPAGGPRALIVFHPGRAGLQTLLQRKLAESMAGEGWQVDLVTAHAASPRDGSVYDLLVLAAPTYNFKPARPLLDHLDRLTSLADKPVALILTGGGMTEEAMAVLRRRVEEKGGRVVRALELWTGRSNSERHGIDDAIEIVRLGALDLARGANASAGPMPARSGEAATRRETYQT
jgi:menaquinone-dependent protoporphyrinogen IX oxidase